MPFRVDEVDAAILRVLMEDGRKPYRQIAKLVGVSTPTVESRVRRMFETGLIKKIAPVIDTDKIHVGNLAVLVMKADPSKLPEICAKLTQMEEVRNAYVSTGDTNLVARVFLNSLKELEEFLSNKISKIDGVEIVSTRMIMRLIKDEQGVIVGPGLGVRLNCDYCGGEIRGDPITYKVLDRDRFLCCRGCLESYKEKYSGRIQSLTKPPPNISRE